MVKLNRRFRAELEHLQTHLQAALRSPLKAASPALMSSRRQPRTRLSTHISDQIVHQREPLTETQKQRRKEENRKTWNDGIQHAFRFPGPQTTDESMFHCGWHLIMTTLFPISGPFVVQFGHHREDARGHADISVDYRVGQNQVPVGMVEIKAPGSSKWLMPSARAAADRQIRARAQGMLAWVPPCVKSVFFLSCFGRRFAIYRLDVGTSVVFPPLLYNEQGQPLAPLRKWWRWDVLHIKGQKYLQDLATAVNMWTRNYDVTVSPREYESDPNDDDVIDPDSLLESEFSGIENDPLVSLFSPFLHEARMTYKFCL